MQISLYPIKCRTPCTTLVALATAQAIGDPGGGEHMFDINAAVISGAEYFPAVKCRATIRIELLPEHLACGLVIYNALPRGR